MMLTPDILSDDDARALLRVACRERGAAHIMAERAGIHPCHISLMLSGDRSINDRVASLLGLKRVRGYVREGRP